MNHTVTHNVTMKELPESERPCEKCLQNGAEALSDAELLAVILRCGSAGENAGELAVRLLCLLQSHGGLGALNHISAEELCECRGIGKVKAVQLLCTAELACRIAREDRRSALRMRTPASIADYFMEDLRHETREVVTAVFFDTRGRLLRSSRISEGTVNASLVSPREVFLEALKYRAVQLVLLHNHPSGDPTPSDEDLDLTLRIEEAGHMIGIPLTDHIIIGDNCYISLKEQGIIL